jgi:3-oxoacyl-[acyl-carrier-protein] synthase-1
MQHPTMADREARPVQVAMCPWMSHKVSVADRIVETLGEALAEALQPIVQRAGSSPSVALLVNLPLARPGLPDDLALRVQDYIGRVYAKTFAALAVAQKGHAGALLGLQSGLAALESGRIEAFIAAGADSYLDLETLEWLEETEQLHGAGARNHAWGFVPGEAAGAVLVMGSDAAERHSLPAFGHLVSVGTSIEQNVIRSESVCLGNGLTTAFRDAFAVLDEHALITDIYCDMNGDPYRADEYGFAVTRTRERFMSPSEFTAAADCWGDVGAASAPLSMALATVAGSKRYARGDIGLIWASSDSGERGAALVAGMADGDD